MLVFLGVDKVHRVAIEGNREDGLGVGAGASDGENRVRVCIEVVGVLIRMVGGREDVGERGGGGFNDFFNVSQSCRVSRSDIPTPGLSFFSLFSMSRFALPRTSASDLGLLDIYLLITSVPFDCTLQSPCTYYLDSSPSRVPPQSRGGTLTVS